MIAPRAMLDRTKLDALRAEQRGTAARGLELAIALIDLESHARRVDDAIAEESCRLLVGIRGAVRYGWTSPARNWELPIRGDGYTAALVNGFRRPSVEKATAPHQRPFVGMPATVVDVRNGHAVMRYSAPILGRVDWPTPVALVRVMPDVAARLGIRGGDLLIASEAEQAPGHVVDAADGDGPTGGATR